MTDANATPDNKPDHKLEEGEGYNDALKRLLGKYSIHIGSKYEADILSCAAVYYADKRTAEVLADLYNNSEPPFHASVEQSRLLSKKFSHRVMLNWR